MNQARLGGLAAHRHAGLPASDPDLPVIASAHVPARAAGAVARLAGALGPGPFAAVLLFASPEADLDALAQDVPLAFGPTRVIGCTTAGEISSEGYAEGELVAIGLPADLFSAETLLIPDLAQIDAQQLAGQLIRARAGLARAHPDWEHEFAFLMVDGLSTREDELAAVLASGLGPVPLFGGSAGDGDRFGRTFVLHEGAIRQNAAVVLLVRSRCRVRVFSLDHLVPTERRMVVTEADPARRIVRQINAEPAAREYARLLGKDPAQLTAFTFAAHPVVVRIGGRHHVRAIQQVAPNGDLIFYSAIDEGLVLTLAEGQDMVAHLDREMERLSEGGVPQAIIAADCILRRMEAQEKQLSGAVSAILRRFRVVGFSTYGEQMNAMHVNQTMTGVAIYAPEGAP